MTQQFAIVLQYLTDDKNIIVLASNDTSIKLFVTKFRWQDAENVMVGFYGIKQESVITPKRFRCIFN